MSGVDKTATNAWYDVEIDPESKLPLGITLTVLTGRKGDTIVKKKRIVGGDHVAFHFRYRLSRYGEIERPEIPPAARKLLASR